MLYLTIHLLISRSLSQIAKHADDLDRQNFLQLVLHILYITLVSPAWMSGIENAARFKCRRVGNCVMAV